MKWIRLFIFSLMTIALVEGCSKSAPLAPSAPAEKKEAALPAPSPGITSTSMAPGSTLKTTPSQTALKPVSSLTSAVTPSVPLKPAGSSVNAVPNSSATSSLLTTVPAKGLETPPVYTYNPEGRKDPFMTFLQGANPTKLVKTSIPLLNYSLSDLKLVAVMVVKKHRFLAMVQTPDSKGYVIKPGMEIGINHGRVHDITDHSISVEEVYTEIGGEKKKRTIILSLRPPEEGQL